jgi:hypothetical protein
MVLLGGKDQEEARFSPFRNSANLDVRYAWFVPNVPQPQKLFWTHPAELQGDVGQAKSRFAPFGDSVGVGAR